jgi:hypothetical protein
MDLLYKYIMLGYKNLEEVIPIKLGIIQGGILLPILADIHMYLFEHWVASYLVFNFNKGENAEKSGIF